MPMKLLKRFMKNWIYENIFTTKARVSLKQIASYLQENNLNKSFITEHLEELKNGSINILTKLPESDNELEINNVLCRKLVVKNYTILYRFDSPQLVRVLLVYKQNRPHL